MNNEAKKAHLRDYWQIVWQGKWTVLAVAISVTTLVAVATFMQTPIFRATARVEIQPRAKTLNPNADFAQIGVTGWSWAAEERYLNTQMEIIRSRAIAEETIQRLLLQEAPQFASLSDPAAALASRVSLRLIPETYVMQISIEDPDPKMAKMLADGVADSYIESNVRAASANAGKMIDELYAQIEPMRKEIEALEKRRVELMRGANYFSPGEQESSIGARIAQVESELTKLKISLGERQAVIDSIVEIERRGGSFESIKVVAEDPIIVKLREDALRLEQEVEELSATLRKGHPVLQAAATKLAEMPRRIATATAGIIDKVKTDYAVEQRRVADLERQLRSMREEGLDLSQAFNDVESLEAELREKRRIYELVTTRIQEIDLNKETLINNIRLLQKASEPGAPVRPRKALNLFAGVMLGLFLGVGAVFFADYLDNTIRGSEDIERYLGLPLLALSPKTDDIGSAGAKEAQQTLRTSVLFASKGRSLNTVHITSAGPSEGKTRHAVQLAKTLAAAGDRVILIDADLRRPTVHKHLGVSRDRGVSSYMMNAEGGDTWRQYVQHPADAEGLEALVSGPLPPKPVELFGSERFADLIAQLKRSYDWVIIDSPPVATLADSVVLAALAEMTVLVIKHKQNDRELVRRSVESLRKVDANIIGAVLNAVDLKRAAYGDYYYASYEYVEDNAKDAKRGRVHSAERG